MGRIFFLWNPSTKSPRGPETLQWSNWGSNFFSVDRFKQRCPRSIRTARFQGKEDFYTHTHTPKTNSKFAPENRPGPKRKQFVFQPSIFRCENLSFGECLPPDCPAKAAPQLGPYFFGGAGSQWGFVLFQLFIKKTVLETCNSTIPIWI